MQTMNNPHQVLALPQTKPGRLAVLFVATHIVFMLTFTALVASGQRGGDTFFSNLWLTVPFLLAGAAALAGGGTALYAVIARGERSIFDWVAIALGLFVIYFAAGEVLFPH